jgi:hypothetical protein
MAPTLLTYGVSIARMLLLVINTMKLHSLKFAAVTGAFVSLVLSAQAASIVGGISLAGDYTLNGTNLSNSTGFVSFTDVEVTSTSGNFSGAGILMATPGSIDHKAFSFAPFPGGGVLPLWTTVAGTAASFDLTSASILFQNSSALLLSGSGILHLAGFDATPGLWTFSANTLSSTFSWSSSNGAVVPDSGTTAVIFALGLSSLALAARRFGVIAK